MNIPVIETSRLLLRGHYPSDLEASVAMWQEPQFYQYLAPKPLSEEEIWTKMLRHMGLWYLCGYGFWAIEEKATGQFIGVAGFGAGQRDITPSLKGYPEIGWLLAAHTHGRGYAIEAAQAVVAWADAHLPESRTVCLIDAGNVPSLRLAAKCGYHEFGRTSYHGLPVVVLERFSAGQAAGGN